MLSYVDDVVDSSRHTRNIGILTYSVNVTENCINQTPQENIIGQNSLQFLTIHKISAIKRLHIFMDFNVHCVQTKNHPLLFSCITLTKSSN